MIIISSLQSQRLVYAVHHGVDLTVSVGSPLEAHAAKDVVTTQLVSLNVSPNDNPQYAALEHLGG